MHRTPIMDMLREVGDAGNTRFCMPGHKGNPDADVNFYPHDITELPGADNLYMPSGVIKKSQSLHARFVGAAHSFFLVNGSTAGVLASVLSVVAQGEKLLMARDMHISAIHAAALAGADVELVFPSGSAAIPAVVTPRDVALAIQKNPDAKALFITYPNYYGLCCDINEICAIAHKAGVKVICDAAHAAAYDFSDLTPLSPAQAACDLWVTSLHKTLPALNQCAVLNVGEHAGVDTGLIQSRLHMLQTTSPSYLLLGSIDQVLADMRENGKERLDIVTALVEEAIRKIEKLGGYRCVTKDVPKDTGAYDRDILRLVIDVTDRGLSGFLAARKLAQQGINIEACDAAHIVLICTVADREQDFKRLLGALNSIKGATYTLGGALPAQELSEHFADKPKVRMHAAMFANQAALPLRESVGCISAVGAGVYPPGVPMLLPGHMITAQMAEALIRLKQQGYELFGCGETVQVADIE